jgi:hypothetical protein
LSLPPRTETLDLQSLNIYFATDPLICQRDDGFGQGKIAHSRCADPYFTLTYFAGLVEMLRRKE